MSPVVRYTRFVLFGKHFLWVAALAIVAILVWIAMGGGDDGKRIVFTNAVQSVALQNIMENPRYQGLTARGEPYTVISNRGTQLDADTIALDVVRAELFQKNGDWVALNSKDGLLNVKAKKLELTGGVNIFYNDGYEMRTDHARVDIAEGTAYGDSHVEGQGPTGTLQADSFAISQRGQVIRFNGSVKMTLYHE